MNGMDLKIAKILLKTAQEIIALQFGTSQQMREYKLEHEIRPDTKIVLKPQLERKKKEEKKKKEQTKMRRSEVRKVRTKNKPLQGLIRGAQSFMENEKFDICFDKKGQFDKSFVMQPLKMDLSTVSPDMKGKSMNINMILIDVGNRKFHKKMMRQFKGLIKDYPPGQGQALWDGDKPYIVVYCDEQNGSKQQVREIAVHETMHLLDAEFDEDYESDGYYGHPVEQDRGEDNNYGIPYPGMPGMDESTSMNIFDERFAEYFTCKAQRKQTTYDVMSLIDDYSKQQKISHREFIQEMIDSLDDKEKFMELYERLGDKGYINSTLGLLYHLAFSKQKNGSKQDAKKILQNLL